MLVILKIMNHMDLELFYGKMETNILANGKKERAMEGGGGAEGATSTWVDGSVEELAREEVAGVVRDARGGREGVPVDLVRVDQLRV